MTSEILAEGQPGVVLLTGGADGALFWATGGAGGCVNRFAQERVELVACEPGGEITGLAQAGDRVFWLSDQAAAGGDALRSLSDTASLGDPPQTHDQGLDLRGLAGGPSLLAARDLGTSLAVAYVATPDDSLPVRRLLLQGGLTRETNYGTWFLGDNEAAVALTESHLFFVIDGEYARLVIRDNHADDDDGDYTVYSDNGLLDIPVGQGWATATHGDSVWVSTRGPSDHGALLHSRGLWDESFLVVELVLRQVDPDDPLKYATDLAHDGYFLYLATTGVGSSADALFRMALNEGSEPERLATLDAPPGSLAVTEDLLVWSEPSTGLIRSMPKP